MKRMNGSWSRSTLWSVVALSAGLVAMAGCGDLKTPSIAVDLPEQYNTPDGMTLDAAGNIILSVPNFNDPKYPPKMVKITPDDKLVDLVTFSPDSPIGKAGPLGVCFGADGNLYISDNPAFGSDEPKARIVRVVMKDGKAEKAEVVVTGFINSNGIAARGDWIYVCESKIDPKADPMPSGVYGFKLSELSGDKPIQLAPGGKDPHLAILFHTKNKDWKVGANGLGFDDEGNMLVCNFGDAQLLKAKIAPDGKAASWKVLAEGQGMLSTDGLSIDRRTGDIYIADFLGNALHKVDPKTGKVTTIARNGITDGSGGALDRPSEPCVRGNKVYVANIDLPLAGNATDKPHTISVVTLHD